MRSETTRGNRRRVASPPAMQATPGDDGARAEFARGGDVAQLLARLEDTSWITAQAISVGAHRGARSERARGAQRAARAAAAGAPGSPLQDLPARPATAAHGRAAGMLAPGARALLDALPLPVLWLDAQGAVRHCNAAALARLGQPLLGLAWRDIVADRLARCVPALQVASNAFCNGQLVLRATAGEVPSVRDTALGWDAGVTVGPSVIDRAAAERERIRERQLVRLGRVSAGLAHQLRTPIAATQLYLDLAAGSGDRTYLEKAQSSLDALTHHCESVLTLARGELRTEADVALSTLLTLVQRQALALRGSLVVTMPDEPLPLPCNPHLLAGAVLNIVDNAMRASPRALAQLVAERHADGVSLTVIDDGDGMPEALRARLGQPLPSTRPEGSGFGLAMANMIVEAHGGRLHIDATPGGGTRVQVLLPTQGTLES
jgi:two-component system sensor histidine kinase FlrB